MVDALLKFVLGLCFITLVFMVNVERTKPITPDLLEAQLKDDTPTPEVTVEKVITPINRIRVEAKPLDAVFSYPEKNTTEEIKRVDFLEHAFLIIDDLQLIRVHQVPEDIFISIDRTNSDALLIDLIDLPTKQELEQLYDEKTYQEYLDIQRTVIVLDDFKIRAFYSLKNGEFAKPLIPALEEYQDVLDARIDNPQKFWSLVSEYEIMIYLEEQNLDKSSDVSAATLYDQIMPMMNEAELEIQKELWQDSPFLALYLDLYN
jgi:hypothetical protein